MNLHIPTMFAMILVASTIMAVSLGVIAYRRLPDLRTWSASLGLQVLAYLMLSLRGQVSDWLSIVLANGCITASLSLYVAGLYRFHKRRYPLWLLWVPLAIVAAGLALWMEDYRARILLSGAVWLAQSLHLLGLVVVYRHQTVGRGQYILGVSAAVFASSMLYRWVATLAGLDASMRLTDATPLVVFTYFSSLTSTLLLAVGALTMIQERYEHALRESEDRYRKLIDSATQGICVLSDLHFRLVNPRTMELLGCSQAELLDKPLLPFVYKDDQPLVKAYHARRLAGKADGIAYAVRMHTRHRGLRWVEISGVLFDWHGSPATLNFLEDITERREAEDQIRDLAYHDTLTHLPNRRLLLDHLELARAAFRRTGKYGALIFIDLDNFKGLNDKYGHAVGDLLLVEVGQRLQRTIRGTDTAARFGGDEFVVLLTQLSNDEATARQQAVGIAEKILAVLEQPYSLAVEQAQSMRTVEHRCTGTAGVVVFAGTGEPDEVLLDRADAAMYEAKVAGRNCVRMSELAGQR